MVNRTDARWSSSIVRGTWIGIAVLIMFGQPNPGFTLGPPQDAPANSRAQSRRSDPSPSDTRRISVVLSRLPSESTLYWGKFDLGEVRAGTSARFELAVRNPYDEPISFSGISVSGAGTRAQADRKQIGPNETLTIRLELETPKSSESNAITVGLAMNRMQEQRVPLVMIQGTGKLTHNLFINRERRVYPVGPGATEWTIPLVTSSPVDPAELEITRSDSFRDMVASIDQKGDATWLKLIVSDASLDPHGTYGTITVASPTLGLSDELEAVFTRNPDLKISPRLVRFLSSEEDSSQLTANVILKLDAPECRKGSIERLLSSVTCTTRHGAPLRISGHHLVDGFYRLELSAPANELSGHSPPHLLWTLNAGKKELKAVSPFLVKGAGEKPR